MVASNVDLYKCTFANEYENLRMAESLSIEIIKTTKAKNKAYLQGFLYTLNRVSAAGNQYWVCEKRGLCNARINTTQEGIVIKPTGVSEIISSHSHGPVPGRSQMLKAYQSMKECASNSGEKPRLILSKGIAKLDETSLIALPRLDSVKRTIRRHKCLDQETSVNQASAAEMIIPDKYRITLKGELFLIHDSGIGDSNRMLIFSAPKMLSLLQESQSWYADGTFKVVPEQFFQLYTIHAEKGSTIIPCIYALLTNKTQATYRKLCTKILEINPELNPFLIMVDFEKAAINAFEEKFLSVVSGCFFHLSQNIYRKIQSAGLTNQYIEDSNFALQIKMLASLAFVPEDKVIQSFTALMVEFPTTAIEIAAYFEETYIGRILRIWNQYTRVNLHVARTNNFVEGWHNGFQSGLSCTHPSFSKLLRFLQLEQSLQEAQLSKWESGDVKSHSKDSIARSKRILAIVTDFENRDVITYLKGIAMNFNF